MQVAFNTGIQISKHVCKHCLHAKQPQLQAITIGEVCYYHWQLEQPMELKLWEQTNAIIQNIKTMFVNIVLNVK